MRSTSACVLLLLSALLFFYGHTQARPYAVVTVQSDRSQIFSGESVTLRCDMKGTEDTDWQYEWWTSSLSQMISTEQEYSIKADKSQNNDYKCRGRRLSEWSAAVELRVRDLPTATVNIVSPPAPHYPGDQVTLQCDIPEYEDWSYSWNMNGQTGPRLDRKTYSFKLDYGSRFEVMCVGTRTGQPQHSQWSGVSTITVTALPTATVNIISPPAPHYPGDQVTLQCDIPEYGDWSYTWFRDNQQVPSETSNLYSFRLTDVSTQYSCQGQRGGQPRKSLHSAGRFISVTALPTATLTVHPPWRNVYSGEKVTLTCSASSLQDWEYRWTFTGSGEKEVAWSGEHGASLILTKAKSSDSGSYQCTGKRSSPPRTSQSSNTVSVSVKDQQPKASLRTDKRDIYTGDTVTLTCTVEDSSKWKFYWYRHTKDSQPVTSTDGPTHTVTPARESEGGQFWCRGGRGHPVYYTQYSSPVHINVTARPYAVVTLHPDWSQIFSGESVTLRCDIKGTEDTDWQYEWRTPSSSRASRTGQEYRIINADESQNGDYRCRGQRGTDNSEWTVAVKLGVKARPQPILRVSPWWLNPGDSVTLSCEVGDSSPGWSFSFYRAVPSLPDQSYSVEVLSGSDQTTGNSITLHSDDLSHTAGYMCRAARGETVYYTDYSQPQFHWSGDQHSSVSLSVSSNRSQHWISESVTLSCEMKENSTGWRLKRFTDRENTVCSSVRGSTTGPTCTIRSLDSEDSGLYWCESGSGEYSNAANITVHNRFVILESPVHPVTEGDSVKLLCKHRSPPSNPKVDFYKDGQLIRNETTGEMTIPAVSKSDEGLYKCKYSDGEESPESWVLVRGLVVPGQGVSLLPRLVCGVVVTSPFLVVTVLLVLICLQKPAKPTKKDKRAELSMQTQRDHLYEDTGL